jgi:hypothetical protein
MSKSHSKRVLAGAVASVALVISPAAFAVENLWTGATSNAWNDPTNWSLGRVPTNNNGATEGDTFDDAVISSTTVIPLIDTDLAATPRDIITGKGAGNVGQVNHVAGTASTGNGNWFYVGRDAGTGTYNLADTSGTGGTLTNFATGSGSLNIGGTDGTAGRLYVGGTEFEAVGSVGTMNINTTGVVTVRNDLAVGTDGGTGVINFDAGTITTGGWNFIGKRANQDDGNGTFNQSGGTLTNSGRTYISNGNSTGKMVLTGGTYNNTGDTFIVGENNSAQAMPAILTVDGGMLNAGEIWIGQAHDDALARHGNGVLNMSSGAIDMNNWFVVGRDGGTGELNMSGGSITKGGGGNFIVGSLGGTGTVTQTNGTIDTTGGGDTLLGENTSTALYDISGGELKTNALLIAWKGGANEMRVSGTATVTADHLEIGEAANNGSGVVNQTGGTVNVSRWLAVGLGSSQQAEYNLSGGTVNAGGVEAGADSAGLISITGTGVLNVAGDTEVPTRNGQGNLTVAGGTLNTANILIGGRDTNTLGSGVVNQSDGSVNVSGNVVVQRPGVGTGAYNLSGGTLSVDGNIDASLGSFSFTGGRITRSNAGVISYTGDLHVGDKSAGLKLDSDKTFSVSGVLDIMSGVTLDVTGLTLPSSGAGSFALGTDGSIAGTFDPSTTTLAGLVNPAGATFISEDAGEGGLFNPDTDKVYWLQEQGGNVTLQYSIAPVPEPTFLGFIGLGAVALVGRRRRR